MAWRTNLFGALAFLIVGGAALVLPEWLTSLATIALANALVVLGLVILWRAGLVPFGQALFYAIGAYTVALLGRYTSWHDALLVVAAGAVVAGVVAFLIGFLLARYRDIFFAMLSLAMSMILYGVLVKTETLGSTDGFHVEAVTFLSFVPHGRARELAVFWFVLALCAAAALFVSFYFRSIAGALAVPVRESEIRLEFLGISVNRLIHLKLVIAGTLAGVGGALAATTVGHIDPDMAFWTTSGEFIFITILAGTGSVVAPFAGALIYEIIHTTAYDLSPNTWQLSLGAALLAIIVFLPAGLWSLFTRYARNP